MKSAFIARAVVFAGAIAFAGAASAQSLEIGVHGPDHDHRPVIVEHEHHGPPPPVVIEHHGDQANCQSRKVVVHHGDGSTSSRTTKNCD
jgi:hypothetical protein